ncbi:MAG TPA: DUF402 domain-containing protein [Actinomycetota bacterium]
MGGTTPGVDAEEPLRRHDEGDVVAIREVWDGRVWEARPAVVVRDDPSLTMLYVPPHVRCRIPVDAKGRELRLPITDWDLAETERGSTRVLSFAFPDTPYAVILGYDDEGLSQYYVNLQSPLRRAPTGFDIVEHVLDVTIPVDRSSWSWKDEDELAEAIAGGLFTEEDAAWFHYWGERAVEHILLREPPFDRDWDDWRPDPSWPEPVLPEGWDRVPA